MTKTAIAGPSGTALTREWATDLDAVLQKLETYCRTRDWAGFDPYDALNSEWFSRTPLARSRIARLALTQLLKRSPLDLRPALGIKPSRDPKATALFVMSYVIQARRGDEKARELADTLANRLLELRSPGTDNWCWGYSFPWQTRSLLVPRFAPNLVTTTFAANALLDAYEIGLGTRYLEAAVGAGAYISQQLYWNDGTRASFAYPHPTTRIPVHNANLLAGALICRLVRLTGRRDGLDDALRVIRYSAGSQRPDGSWPYGLAPTQQWVDNFHTGYNLCALMSIGSDIETDEFKDVTCRGLEFYISHFFRADGAPKYFHDQTFPIDIHCVAQSIITLVTFRTVDSRCTALADAVMAWTLSHMWDEGSFFHYRVLRSMTIRTCYMRWSQAWMLLAIVHSTPPSSMPHPSAAS